MTNCGKFLNEIGIPGHRICLLRNLYTDQETTIRTKHRTMDWFKTGKGVWQGCILLLCLTYMQISSYEMPGWMNQAGIKTAGRNINNLRHEDDTTLMVESEELKSLLMRVKRAKKLAWNFILRRSNIYHNETQYENKTRVKSERHTVATWCEQPTHWKIPWCWERLKAGKVGENRGWDGRMASPIQATCVWAKSGR